MTRLCFCARRLILNSLKFVSPSVGYLLKSLVYVSDSEGEVLNSLVSAWVGYVLISLVYVSVSVSYILNSLLYVSAWVGYVLKSLLYVSASVGYVQITCLCVCLFCISTRLVYVPYYFLCSYLTRLGIVFYTCKVLQCLCLCFVQFVDTLIDIW